MSWNKICWSDILQMTVQWIIKGNIKSQLLSSEKKSRKTIQTVWCCSEAWGKEWHYVLVSCICQALHVTLCRDFHTKFSLHGNNANKALLFCNFIVAELILCQFSVWCSSLSILWSCCCSSEMSHFLLQYLSILYSQKWAWFKCDVVLTN